MSSDAKDGGKAGFSVTDRRIFADEQGTARVEEPRSEPGAPGPPGAAPSGPPSAPPVDFHTFILSLGSSALLHLGELERPEGPVEKDLTLAKHTIDILAMLQQKTRGNLTPAEDKLIESLLYELRIRYVDAQK
ncbi:MAG: hypothetical protein JWM82_3788 [Myxococcales bacterium]|nr:hypothetical protein [Myxococcales bacterium]